MDAVLSIWELLELFLLRLDMTTLLVSASRVSKKWHRLISTSSTIQQALFFKPIPNTATPAKLVRLALHPKDDKIHYKGLNFNNEDKSSAVFNPLLVEKFGTCFFDLEREVGYYRRATAFYKLPWTDKARKLAAAGDIPGEGVKPAEMPAETAQGEAIARRPFTRLGASWRRMLVSQPPPPQLGYSSTEMRSENFDADGQTVYISLVTPDTRVPSIGLRMGELYDIVQYNSGHYELHSLWFRIVWGQIREPYVSAVCQETCHSLLAQTSVVVELYPFNDSAWSMNPPEPAVVGIFDKVFRCDEHRDLDVATSVVTAELSSQWYPAAWDVFAIVW